MSPTSMSLKSLQFLLQHMDSNKRFEISQHCPALREIEKSVPLKINCLVLTESSVTVNNTIYEIGIIRKCHVGEAPEYVTASNERGGDLYEVDDYGIAVESDTQTVTPGDLVINPREDQLVDNDELHIGHLEEEIQHVEGELANLRERRPNRNLENVHELKSIIEDYRAMLFEYQCRHASTPSIYEFFFQITKTRTVDKQEQKTVERYKRNKKFSEAMKQLTTVLFGGRCSPIYVTKFEFFCSQGVVRLPVGLKLQIEQLVFSAGFGTSVGVLAPILNESSYPLKKLDVNIWSDEDATSPIVKTAGILRIRVVLNHLQTMSAITNPIVHLHMLMPFGQTTLLEELVEHWIELKRPVGFEYIFGFNQEPGFAMEMEDILKRFNGKPVDDENVIIPMSAVTQIKVSYGPFPEFAPRAKWAVRFSTEAIEE